MLFGLRRLTMRGATITALVAAFVGALAAPCAAGVRAGGSPRCSPGGDWPILKSGTIQSVVAAEPGNTLRRVVMIDFDRDGDLDIVAATDRGVRLWLNDGQGNLTAQSPQSAPAVASVVAMSADTGRAEDSSESIQNDLPSFRVQRAYAHAPPDAARGTAVVASTSSLRGASRGSLVPRAPPL